jgi:hypothetical protein
MGITILDLTTPEGMAASREYDRQQEECVRTGQQLYAKVKKSSKYCSQNTYAETDPERWGWPFRVRVDPGEGDYCVLGGPGGRYRLADINLFVIEDGRELRIT